MMLRENYPGSLMYILCKSCKRNADFQQEGIKPIRLLERRFLIQDGFENSHKNNQSCQMRQINLLNQ